MNNSFFMSWIVSAGCQEGFRRKVTFQTYIICNEIADLEISLFLKMEKIFE